MPTSKNQEWLLRSAREALEYLEKLNQGRTTRGQYEGISIGRNLHAAIEAVDNDLIHDARQMLEQGRH